MPPDGKVALGALAVPGLSKDGLRLGDTVGRTPGAYSFIISCNLEGYVAPGSTITAGTLVLTQSSLTGINPLGPGWTSDAGRGPTKVVADMVRCHARWSYSMQ